MSGYKAERPKMDGQTKRGEESQGAGSQRPELRRMGYAEGMRSLHVRSMQAAAEAIREPAPTHETEEEPDAAEDHEAVAPGLATDVLRLLEDEDGSDAPSGGNLPGGAVEAATDVETPTQEAPSGQPELAPEKKPPVDDSGPEAPDASELEAISGILDDAQKVPEAADDETSETDVEAQVEPEAVKPPPDVAQAAAAVAVKAPPDAAKLGGDAPVPDMGAVEARVEQEAAPATAEAPAVSQAKTRASQVLGQDLSHVKVALESPLAHEAEAEGATVGGDVHLAGGLEDLQTADGQDTIAHELVHAAQQRQGGAGPVSTEAEAEHEAHSTARDITAGRRGPRPKARPTRGKRLHKKSPKAAPKAKAAKSQTRDQKLIASMKKSGIVNCKLVLAEARRAGIPLSLACSMLIQESGGGANVFGHDGVKPGQIVGGKVTEARYGKYKSLRKQGYGMQGVGPMQLTWYTLQDQADKLGGCWKPKWNLRVAFDHLAGLMGANGKFGGVKAYNGSGTAATNYAKTVLAREKSFQAKFAKIKGDSGAKPTKPKKPGAPGGAKTPKPKADKNLNKSQVKQALKYNRGRKLSAFEIKRIQEAMHMARTGKLSAALVQEIADFQRNVGIEADGMVGPQTMKRILKHLKRSHALGKMLTAAERREARLYNKKRKLPRATVKKVQKWLGVGADGAIGPNTTNAIAKFQKKVGLPPSGKLSPLTIKKLRKWSKNQGGAAGFPSHGSSKAKLNWATKLAKKIGLWITSTTGGKHAPGSYHYSGRAFDCAGSAGKMADFYRAAKKTKPTELFYDPLGGIKYGQEIGAIGGHSDHVHIAY